jgi:predicted nucleotidyltransferase
MAELEDVLNYAVKALEKAQIPYVIVGGFAAILHGSPRTTSDIDMIVKVEKKQIPILIEAFRQEGFDIMESQITLALNEGANASIFRKDTVIRIDLKAARNYDELEVLQQAKTEHFRDNNIQMASVEQILYGKILYLGDISDLEDEELLDFNDARDFVNVYRTAKKLDLNWLKQKVKNKNLEETLNRLLKKAGKKEDK